MFPALPTPLRHCRLVAVALVALAVTPPPPSSPKEKAARLGIQLQVLPDCSAQPTAEGCVQPASRTPDGSREPEQISGLSPAPERSSEDAPPVVTRTW